MPNRPLNWEDLRLFRSVAACGSINQGVRKRQVDHCVGSHPLGDMAHGVREALLQGHATARLPPAAGLGLLPRRRWVAAALAAPLQVIRDRATVGAATAPTPQS